MCKENSLEVPTKISTNFATCRRAVWSIFLCTTSTGNYYLLVPCFLIVLSPFWISNIINTMPEYRSSTK